jgi:large subunit ribosomal protein L1
MRKRSKSYKVKVDKLDRIQRYSFDKAVEILKSLPKAKFDETLDLAIKLGIDPKQSDQNVRGAVPLPKGTGKKVRVTVIAEPDLAKKALDAGADNAGFEDLIAKIKGGWLDFDMLIASPSAMQQVRTLGKILGPKGLMPNPKTGTVTDQVDKAVREAKAGRVEFRIDKGACLHIPVGKLSFKKENLLENLNAVMQSVIRAKPASAKGVYIESCSLSSTMGPSVKIDVSQIMQVNQ